MKLHLRVVVLICMALLLSACFGKKTPQEVTEAFWEAVIDSDAKSAVKYSTLTDVQEYDGFSRDWSGLRPVLGKVVIDGEEASIVTELTGSDKAGDAPVKLVTHLVRQDDKWKVDYVRTREELSGGVLGNLLGGLNRLGKQITGKLSAASEDLSTEMERIGKQLEERSDSINEQLSENIEKYGEAIREGIDEMADSVERALEEHEKSLPEKDRRVLREVATDLNESSENLSKLTIRSIAESGKSVVFAWKRLDAIDGEAIQPYKEQWQKWEERIGADMQKMVDELSAAAKS